MNTLADINDYVLIGESLLADKNSKKYVSVDELRQSAIDLYKKLEALDCTFSHTPSYMYCVDCDRKITKPKEWREEHMKKNHLVLWDVIQVQILMKFLKKRYNLTENDVVAHANVK